jgi:ribosome-associated toxin RatA of RatAB toxin-antitoxin module
MRSQIAIEVAAPPELVFRLARDVRRWPDLLPHYVSVRSAGDQDNVGIGSVATLRMVARRPLIEALGLELPVTWQARTWNEPESLRLRFRHVAGATKGMDVTWRIEPTASGSRVSIEHDFRPRLKAYAILVDRWFIRPIAGRTLATFKALAEALAEPAREPSPDPLESELPVSTNP